LNIPDTVGG